MENLNNNVKGEFCSTRFNYYVNINVANVLKIEIEYYISAFINKNKIEIEFEISDYNKLIFMDREIEDIRGFFDTQNKIGIDFKEMIIEESIKIDIVECVKNDYKNLFDFMVQNNIK